MKKINLKKETLFQFKNSKNQGKLQKKDPTTTFMTFTVTSTSYY